MLNRRPMGKFKSAIDELELRELPLHGRKFTWTSEQSAQSEATMTRIDKIFCSISWEEIFPTAHLHAWASTLFDHCPLILQGDTSQGRLRVLDLSLIGSTFQAS
jgi:exonuclease III